LKYHAAVRHLQRSRTGRQVGQKQRQAAAEKLADKIQPRVLQTDLADAGQADRDGRIEVRARYAPTI